jgi:polar amino acid transport system substrate-binding protein
VLDGRFHVVEQAVGTPRGRGGDAALPFLEAFVAEATGGGLVAELIREHGVEGKVVVAS